MAKLAAPHNTYNTILAHPNEDYEITVGNEHGETFLSIADTETGKRIEFFITHKSSAALIKALIDQITGD